MRTAAITALLIFGLGACTPLGVATKVVTAPVRVLTWVAPVMVAPQSPDISNTTQTSVLIA